LIDQQTDRLKAICLPIQSDATPWATINQRPRDGTITQHYIKMPP